MTKPTIIADIIPTIIITVVGSNTLWSVFLSKLSAKDNSLSSIKTPSLLNSDMFSWTGVLPGIGTTTPLSLSSGIGFSCSWDLVFSILFIVFWCSSGVAPTMEIVPSLFVLNNNFTCVSSWENSVFLILSIWSNNLSSFSVK